MTNGKRVILLINVAIFTQVIGSVLNHIVISLNQDMPTTGLIVALGKHTPINQGTKLVILADVLRVGDYALSIGDLFFLIGTIIDIIILWIAIPQGRKFFPLLVISVFMLFLSIGEPNNMKSIILCETASVSTILAMYWSYRSSMKKKAWVKNKPGLLNKTTNSISNRI